MHLVPSSGFKVKLYNSECSALTSRGPCDARNFLPPQHV